MSALEISFSFLVQKERADLAQPPRLGLLLFVLGGCPAGAERRTRTAEDTEVKVRQKKNQRQRYNIRSTFETSEYNTCNMRLKADETYET